MKLNSEWSHVFKCLSRSFRAPAEDWKMVAQNGRTGCARFWIIFWFNNSTCSLQFHAMQTMVLGASSYVQYSWKERSPSCFHTEYVLYLDRRGRICGSCWMSQNFVRFIKDQFFVRQNTFATCSADDDAFFSVFRKYFDDWHRTRLNKPITTRQTYIFLIKGSKELGEHDVHL